LTVEANDAGEVVKVTGNQCPKGDKYGTAEVTNPTRTLTAGVLAEGLELKMVPVRTDKPIPKARIMAAMTAVKKIRLTKPVKCGDAVVENFLGLGVNLVATRSVEK